MVIYQEYNWFINTSSELVPFGTKSIQWNVENQSLQRMGQDLCMEDLRPARRAILGWLSAPQSLEGMRKKRATHHNTGGPT